MKSQITRCIKSLIFLILILVASNCKKEKKEEPISTVTPVVTTGTITVDHENVNQLEIVSMTSQNISFTQFQYSGIIGGKFVTIAVFKDKLGFQIPELSAGDYKLETTIEGKKFSLNFKIAIMANIASPTAYIQETKKTTEYSLAYLTAFSKATANMKGAENNTENNKILLDYSLDLEAKINAASADDKLMLARFMLANPILFAPLEDVIKNIDSLNMHKINFTYTDDEVLLIEQEVRKRMAVIKTLTAVGVLLQIYALETPEPWTKLAAAAGWVAVAYKVKGLHDYLLTTFDKSLVQFGGMEMDEVKEKKSAIYPFIKNTRYSFGMSSSYRNLYADDMTSGYFIISSIVSSLNTFEDCWNKIMNSLPTSLVGKPFHIKNVFSISVNTFRVDPKYLSINGISNSNVSVLSSNGTELSATFNTTEATDQNFNFNISYNNPGVESNYSIYSAVIISDSFSIGQHYQGGIIFYLDKTKKHGLIAAADDQVIGEGKYGKDDPGAAWGRDTLISGAYGMGIGTGSSNTSAIIAALNTPGIAARICDDLVLKGYSDWFLPSYDELALLYKNLYYPDTMPGFAYWSSTQCSMNPGDYGGMQIECTASPPNNGCFYSTCKLSVRAIRAF